MDLEALKGFLPPNSLTDAALTTLLADAIAAVNEQIGPPGDATEFLRASGDLLKISRQASEVVSITERDVVLEDEDWRLWPSGTIVQRLATGPNPRRSWDGRVEVTYTAAEDTANRDRVIADLVKLEIAFNPGLASQTVGAWSEAYTTETAGGHTEQRAAILGSLEPAGFIL